MQINFIILFLIAHVIGYYYLQDDKMIDLKENEIKNVFKHSIFYSIPFILIFIGLEKSYELILLLALLCLSHFMIDIIKYYSYKVYLKIFVTEAKKNKVKKYIKQWMIYIYWIKCYI